mgnify:CR=1 FL=1
MSEDNPIEDGISYFQVKNIRHPIIEQIKHDTPYIANDLEMNASGILLFGINAVGKSSLMKSIGINVIMAQAGMYVAASEFTYHPYKYLFTRIRSNDNLYAGLSSFEVEMKEFKVILKYANSESIILGDELCSGTETTSALAIVTAGVIRLCQKNASFIFTTHLHKLADMNEIKNDQHKLNVSTSCKCNEFEDKLAIAVEALNVYADDDVIGTVARKALEKLK